MVGVIPGDVVMHEKPVGRGYVRLNETGENPWPTSVGSSPVPEVHGHEFHYSSLDNLDPSGLKYAYEVKRGHGIDGHHDGIVYKNLLASYAHLRSLGAYNGQPDSLLLCAARHKEQTSRWTRGAAP